MRKAKPILLGLCIALVAAVSILGTMAYLTDTATTVNTFTMGQVELKLDEAVVDTNGNPTGGRTENGNQYHLVPGQTYTKDPTVTVLGDSEESYVRMLLTLNCCKELDAIFAPGGAVLTEIFNGYDASNWIYETETRDSEANTITYEFRYKEPVDPSGSDVVLDALFDSITVPQNISGAQLASIADFKITVEAHAIQAVGFADADEAWEAFSK